MEKVLAFVCLIVGSFLQSVSTQLQQESGGPTPTVEQCPDTHGWSGKYENFSYGFSVLIPQGYEGFWNSARCVNDKKDGFCVCMSDHGRIIPLSSEPYEPERHIEIYASHGADLDEPSVAEGVAHWLGYLKKQSVAHTMLVRRRSDVTIDRVQGQRVVVRYRDKRLRQWFVEDLVELLKNGDEFTLYLRTPAKSYEHDKRIFDRVVASFAFGPSETNKAQE